MNIISSNTINSIRIEQAPFDIIRKIKGIQVILSEYPSYLVDESKLEGTAEWLFFPKSEAEIISIINFLKEKNIKACISGARTGIVGSCVPISGSIISIEKMNKILGFGFDESRGRYYVRLEPGITLKVLNDKISKKEIDKVKEFTPNVISRFKEDKKSYYYPMDPTEMSASIGGTVATNASGARTFKYGATRKWIKRIRVIVNGEVLEIPRGKYFAANDGKFIIKRTDGTEIIFKIPNYEFNTSVKNAAGIYAKPNMDLIDLFIGSEGIFGVITEVEVWIKEKHPLISNVLFFNRENDALSFVKKICNNPMINPEFIEFFSGEAIDLLRDVQDKTPSIINMPKIPSKARSAIFFDLPYSEDNIVACFGKIEKIAKQCNTTLEASWSGYDNRESARFKHFRHILPETINSIIADRKRKFPDLHKLGTDISVPEEKFAEMMKYYHSILREATLDYVIFGHIGDNHVHVNILPKNIEELELGLEIYEKFARKAVDYGGSVSAEHGIGKIKRDILKIMYNEKAIEDMRSIKKALDPLLMFNCGNIFEIMEE
ncbi:MAG: FAD-binding oxidoreductase [Candidatus Hodarchaeota archaeon]